MSHFVNIVTQMKDGTALVRALEKLGFKGKVEVYEVAQNLYGYQGDKRSQKAHIILRRKHVGPSSNDIGFEKQADGSYAAHISEFDGGTGQYADSRARSGAKWQGQLKAYYGLEKSKMEFDKKHLKYVEDVDEQNRPRLRVKF